MLKRVCQLAFLALATSSLFSCNVRESAPGDRNELVVVMDEQMPGYFVLNGERYGYQYDLFKAYADARGKQLRVVDGQKPSVYANMLEKGEVDVLTTLSDHVGKADRPYEVPIYQTSYVLLCGSRLAAEVRRDPDFELIPFLKRGKVLVSSGFKGTKAYSTLLDSLPANVYVSSCNSFDLIESVANGTYDYVICEMSEAQLGCAMIRKVEEVYSFSEPIALSAVVTPLDPTLKTDFENWLEAYRGSLEYAVLNDLYFEKGIVGALMNKGISGYLPGRISAYDEVFKRVCEREGYDWRFISAIAYNESRFNPDVVSQKGAQGLMQVMPRVARQFGVKGDLKDPENNVLLALKVLGKIEKSLDFAPETSWTDRMQIVLACYNAGLGHVLDARNLARKRGGNPDSWKEVSACLKAKANPEVAQDDAVKCGTFNSRQTLAFVNEVWSRYHVYCHHIER